MVAFCCWTRGRGSRRRVLLWTDRHRIRINGRQHLGFHYAQDFRDFISTLPGWKAGGSTLVFSIPYQSGLKLIVRTERVKSLKPNSPVYYRGVQVGVVQKIDLSPDAAGSDVQVLSR